MARSRQHFDVASVRGQLFIRAWVRYVQYVVGRGHVRLILSKLVIRYHQQFDVHPRPASARLGHQSSRYGQPDLSRMPIDRLLFRFTWGMVGNDNRSNRSDRDTVRDRGVVASSKTTRSTARSIKERSEPQAPSVLSCYFNAISSALTFSRIKSK